MSASKKKKRQGGTAKGEVTRERRRKAASGTAAMPRWSATRVCRCAEQMLGELEVVFEPDAELLAAAEAELGSWPDPRRGHHVIDPEALRGAIGDDFDTADAEDIATSTEEAGRLRRLRKLAADPDALYKPHLVADAALISRLEGVRATASNAGEVIGLVTRAARISALTQAPIDILPIILLGPPGCGKSRVIRELGRALDTPVLTFLGSSMADATQVLGSGTGWKGAAPGRLAETLLQSPTSSPLFVAEEVEKLRLWDRRESASDILLGLLDRQMAAAHEDAYLRVPMRADRAIWLLAANTLDNLSEPLLDRCLIVEMRSPEREERRDIVARMHAETRAQLGLDPEVTLDGSVTEPLREISLRRIGPLFQVALGHAVEAGRDRLEVADIIWARTVVERGREPGRARAGFLP